MDNMKLMRFFAQNGMVVRSLSEYGDGRMEISLEPKFCASDFDRFRALYMGEPMPVKKKSYIGRRSVYGKQQAI